MVEDARRAETMAERLENDFESDRRGQEDDDPIDLAIAPSNFANYPNYIIVADRGMDGDSENTLYYIDPATTELNQVGYQNYLVAPSVVSVGGFSRHGRLY